MDRVIVYPGSIPLETDILNTNRNTMTALAKISGAVFGTGTTLNGLGVVPTSPASLQVNVSPGEIYSYQPLDGAAYSSLAADTVHQVVKQGILLSQVALNCPAPTTPGQSIVYLIQAAFADVDGTPVALPYYNASNPSVAWSGPNNTGTQQNTVRSSSILLNAKAGTAATTGSQTIPTPDTGYVSLYAVTVAYNQTQITATGIAKFYATPFLPLSGIVGNLRASVVQLVGSSTLLPSQSGMLVQMLYNGGTALLPAPAQTLSGLTYYFSTPLAVSMTVSTPSGLFYAGGVPPSANYFMPAGMSATVVCDGTNWVVQSVSLGTPSLAASGYQRLPSGLLLQWGAGYISGTSGTFNYPVAFTSAVYMTIGSDVGAGTRAVSLAASSLSQCNVYGSVATTNFNYLAIGV